MRIAIVVQRYGVEVTGGAELHARRLAELLRTTHEVEVWTTCAVDYVTWANHYPAGTDTVHGVPVRRFPVRRPRDPRKYGEYEQYLLTHPHTETEELRWLELEGPWTPQMVRAIRKHRDRFDMWIFYSFRYYTAFHGARCVPDRAVLVPTAEQDPIIQFQIFHQLFHNVRGVVYNTPEERRFVEGIIRNYRIPAVVTGIYVPPPERAPDPDRFRQQFGIERPYVLFIGRIDRNKGAPQLAEMYLRYVEHNPQAPLLVMAGLPVDPVPDHPFIRLVGRIDESLKWDALAGCLFLINPSPYESLSIVLLEAWTLKKAVLVNGQCPVLKGQCIRSNGGLYYSHPREWMAMMDWMLRYPEMCTQLGLYGYAYVQARYRPEVVRGHYEDLFRQIRPEVYRRIA